MKRIPTFKKYVRHHKWWILFWLHGKRNRWPAGDDETAADVLISKTILAIQEKRFDGKRESVVGTVEPNGTAKRIKFRELSSTFYKRHSVKLKAPEAVELQLRVLDRRFGERNVDTITTADVDEFLADRYAVVKAKTADKSQITLKQVLGKAVEWGYIKANPAAATKPAGDEDDAREFFLTRPEADKLLDACPGWLRPLVLAAFLTGGRRSELLKLTWQDVSLTGKTVRYRHTKNKRHRTVPMPDELVEAIKALPNRKGQIEAGRVFLGPDGAPLEKEALRYAFDKARDDAGLSRTVEGADGTTETLRFRLHDARHTYASWLVQAGVSLYQVQKLLGHSSVTMTERYSHLAPDHLKAAIEALNRTTATETATGTVTTLRAVESPAAVSA
jgi:integrase